MDLFLQPGTWIGIMTLVIMEILLGIDNVVFISIITNKLDIEQRAPALTIGLYLALILRLFLLLGISWLTKFNSTFLVILGHNLSIRDLIFCCSGLFLLGRSSSELINKMNLDKVKEHYSARPSGINSFKGVILQIVVVDIIFSLDSVLTAVGLTNVIGIMVVALIISALIMQRFSLLISRYLKKYQSMEILAYGFLILIGFVLMLEGLHQSIPKGYLYFALIFSFLIELINARKRRIRTTASFRKEVDSTTSISKTNTAGVFSKVE